MKTTLTKDDPSGWYLCTLACHKDLPEYPMRWNGKMLQPSLPNDDELSGYEVERFTNFRRLVEAPRNHSGNPNIEAVGYSGGEVVLQCNCCGAQQKISKPAYAALHEPVEAPAVGVERVTLDKPDSPGLWEREDEVYRVWYDGRTDMIQRIDTHNGFVGNTHPLENCSPGNWQKLVAREPIPADYSNATAVDLEGGSFDFEPIATELPIVSCEKCGGSETSEVEPTHSQWEHGNREQERCPDCDFTPLSNAEQIDLFRQMQKWLDGNGGKLTEKTFLVCEMENLYRMRQTVYQLQANIRGGDTAIRALEQQCEVLDRENESLKEDIATKYCSKIEANRRIATAQQEAASVFVPEIERLKTIIAAPASPPPTSNEEAKRELRKWLSFLGSSQADEVVTKAAEIFGRTISLDQAKHDFIARLLREGPPGIDREWVASLAVESFGRCGEHREMPSPNHTYGTRGNCKCVNCLETNAASLQQTIQRQAEEIEGLKADLKASQPAPVKEFTDEWLMSRGLEWCDEQEAWWCYLPVANSKQYPLLYVNGQWKIGTVPLFDPAPAEPVVIEGKGQAVTEQFKAYVASRASLPERPAMWRKLREQGWAITSTWIDEAGEGETGDFSELWGRIFNEIAEADCVVLYAEEGDLPLKGALIEVGIAIGMYKPVFVCLPGVALDARNFRPVGSWLAHPLVERINSLELIGKKLGFPPRPSFTAPPKPGAPQHLYRIRKGNDQGTHYWGFPATGMAIGQGAELLIAGELQFYNFEWAEEVDQTTGEPIETAEVRG